MIQKIKDNFIIVVGFIVAVILFVPRIVTLFLVNKNREELDKEIKIQKELEKVIKYREIEDAKLRERIRLLNSTDHSDEDWHKK